APGRTGPPGRFLPDPGDHGDEHDARPDPEPAAERAGPEHDDPVPAGVLPLDVLPVVRRLLAHRRRAAERDRDPRIHPGPAVVPARAGVEPRPLPRRLPDRVLISIPLYRDPHGCNSGDV